MPNNQSEDQKNLKTGAIPFLIICVILYFIAKSCFSGDTPQELAEKSANEQAYKEEDLKISALVNSQSCVENQLKAPATAEFPTDISHVTKLENGKYLIKSYVDAQNSFGAQIRTKYSCVVILLEGDHYRCEELKLLE